MIQPIMTNQIFLAQPSAVASAADIQTARDLIDTLTAHNHECVGMAANMIGVLKRIIVFDDESTYQVMFNPEIISSAGEFETEEGCLSLVGRRPTTRYRTIKVYFEDLDFHSKTRTYTGWTTQIIQYEIDHCNGIII
ncbi:MAG: peptide deformylase [Raoultibacter sp.]